MVTKSGIGLSACGEQLFQLEPPRDRFWVDGLDHDICAWDNMMQSLNMPRISPLVVGLEIEFAPTDPEYAGIYLYHMNKIRFFNHRWPNPIHWHDSVVNHELWHLYEDQALYLTEYEWMQMSDNLEIVENDEPRHFLLGGLAYRMQREIMLDAADAFSEPREVECEF